MREALVGNAVYAACNAHVRESVRRNQHPSVERVKQLSEAALLALRTRGHLPPDVDCTVTAEVIVTKGRFKLQIHYSSSLYAWLGRRRGQA